MSRINSLVKVPVYLFFMWVNQGVIPNVSYNAYVHDFPWFGVTWYNKSVQCTIEVCALNKYCTKNQSPAQEHDATKHNALEHCM